MIHKPLAKLFHRAKPGRRPGISHTELPTTTPATPVEISHIDYGPDTFTSQPITDLPAFLATPLPPGFTVRWINICGLADTNAIAQLASRYQLHALAVEDILHIPQRPKVETFPADTPDRVGLFIIAQMNRLIDNAVDTEQVSICLGANTLLTFQQRPGDVWDPIRERIKLPGARFRQRKTGYLTYALLDAVIDHNFSILEHYGNTLESLESQVLEGNAQNVTAHIHQVRRELLLLRRQVWPMREVVHTLQREDNDYISDETQLFLRDAYDHAVQVLDVVETYREMAGGIAETQMTIVGNRMNEIMKTLTMVAAVFIPISFLAGVFGMNFDDVPGLHFPGAFTTFALTCTAITAAMAIWFRRKGWW